MTLILAFILFAIVGCCSVVPAEPTRYTIQMWDCAVCAWAVDGKVYDELDAISLAMSVGHIVSVQVVDTNGKVVFRPGE